MGYSRKRQRFLINQGYAYKVVNRLPGLDKAQLAFSTLDAQMQLLQQVISASDADAEEEEIKEELGEKFMRKESSMANLSGAHAVSYAQKGKVRFSSTAERHPLFKRFRK